MIGGGPFGLRAGEWTDDTSMALCLAESLVECRAFRPADQLARYVRWWRSGHLSSNGRCFDIGNQTRDALQRFERSGSPDPASPDPDKAGNGSLMRLAPVPLVFTSSVEAAIEHSGSSSRTTHPAPRAVDACRYMGALLAGAVAGAPKGQLLAADYWGWGDLHPEIDTVARGSFLRKQPPEIRGGGYVVHCLEAALWAFARSSTFREGALLAVNLGGDADTTGAVYGQLAGAVYGEHGIPGEWRARLALRDTICDLADRLEQLAL
jgi:ADP-ribosyl-[dinitrogen reductase] hydrolase